MKKNRIPSRALLGACLCLAMSAQAFAQEGANPGRTPPAPQAPAEESEEVVVVAAPRGEVPDAIPERTLTPTDIQSYGASNVGEVVEALSTQTNGPPIILINGQRMSDPSELAGLPPEAIERMDILPPEVAARFGYPPTQRVLNIVVRRNFSGRTLEARDGGTWRGLGDRHALSLGDHNLTPGARRSLTFSLDDQNGFTRAQAGASPPIGLDDRDAITAGPETLNGEMTGTWRQRLNDDVSVSLNGKLSARNSEGLAGSDGSGRAITTTSATDAAQLNLGFNGTLGERTRWTLGAGLQDQQTQSDIRADAGSRTTNESTAYALNGSANGALFQIDDAPVGWGLEANYGLQTLEGRTTTGSSTLSTSRSSESWGAGATLNVPLVTEHSPLAPLLGAAGAYARFGFDGSDAFDPATSLDAGLSWQPTPELDIAFQTKTATRAPDIDQLSAAPSTSPGVSVYDPRTGESAVVAITNGGNPSLRAEETNALSLSATWRAPLGLLLRASYEDSSASNVISAFPQVSAALEAAFPDRFTRDGGGDLTAIDERAINLAERNRSSVSAMLSWRRRFDGDDRGGPQAPRVAASVNRDDRMEAAAGSGFDLTLSYAHRLQDDVILAPGAPALDLLDGGSLGDAGGVDSLELSTGVLWRGLGVRLSGKWTGGYDLDGQTPADDLHFSDLATLSLRSFVNFNAASDLVACIPALHDARLSLEIENLLDETQDVRDESGSTPYAYQPALLDPRGRTWSLAFRRRL